jgi:hypothetical protein
MSRPVDCDRPGHCAECHGRGSHANCCENSDGRRYADGLPHPVPGGLAAHRFDAHLVRRLTGGGLQEITQLPVHLIHPAFGSISSASRGSARSRATAFAIVLLTVPTAQPSTWAT